MRTVDEVIREEYVRFGVPADQIVTDTHLEIEFAHDNRVQGGEGRPCLHHACASSPVAA